jgi:hypothetical protein
MPKLSSRQAQKAQGPGLDQKAVFDAGYKSYEDGTVSCDFGLASETSAGDAGFATMWRYGWCRAQEDSCLS